MSDIPNEMPASSDGIEPKHGFGRWNSQYPQTVGFVLGITASLVAALIFYVLVESKSRDLSLFINPTRTTIVKAGQSSDLHVLYKGQSVSTDVTALQVEIWNAGKESIRQEHILSPIVLQTSFKLPILEVRLRHISRPVCGIALDESQLADGKVGLTWKILEHNDGAVIQFIVAGPSTVSVNPKGELEGQRRVKVLADRTSNWWVMSLYALLGAGTVNWGMSWVAGRRFGKRPWSGILFTLGYMLFMYGVFWGIYEILLKTNLPFAF
jgi:hypothetical protein